MKKAVLILIALTVAALLCSCTPDADSVRKSYEDNGYSVEDLSAEDAAESYDVDTDEVKYVFKASKPLHKVTVIAFNDGDDAKEFYDGMNSDSAPYKIVKKGNAVIFGDEESVKLF